MNDKILLVEDDPKLAGFIAEELILEGYQVNVSTNGLDGLTMARTIQPDLLILDWMLPGISGLDLCLRLRSTGIQVPIIMLTAKDEIPDPHALSVACHHQGALVTEDNTENLFYKTPEVLEFLSTYLTLEPGDIVSMGTALKKSAKGGAIQNVDLAKLGGPVSVTIEKIGTLVNTVVNV